MTDILVNWLNNDVKLSVPIDAFNFAHEFTTGYLIGEVLAKHQLQDDFDLFSQSRTADSQLNNFTRLEPVLHLLGVSFDTNVARDVMTAKQGVATRLMYQLFIALNKKQKANLTGAAMETMRPAAPVKLEGVESKIYKERLKHRTPRQTDLNLEALVDRFHQKQIQLEQTAFRERFLEEQNHEEMLQNKRKELISQYKDNVAKKSEVLAKIQAATVHIPKPPPSKTAKAIAMRRQLRKAKEAQDMQNELDSFEDKLKRTIPPSKPLGEEEAGDSRDVADLPDTLHAIKPTSSSDYINKIRKRLNEDSRAREEREKRRRKVLQDQLGSHEAQEEAKREEILVNRLMRQSQQERRIAVQLLQTRHEKEVVRNNRMQREKMYEEKRLLEFEEALNREKEMARLAKIEYEEQTEKDRELHNQMMSQHAEAKYRKHYDFASRILDDIIDFSCKVAEYRELTNRLVPQKLYREWKTLFEEGQPLYEQGVVAASEVVEPTAEEILEEERQLLLDEGDFNEYTQMMGEWLPPEDTEPPIEGPPRSNPIVGHIVQRLFDIVHPPSPPPPPPEFPPFPIKACVLGKAFSGKTTCIKQLAESHRLIVLDVETLVEEAIEANKNDELMEIKEETPPPPDEASPPLDPTPVLPASEQQLDTTHTTGEPPASGDPPPPGGTPAQSIQQMSAKGSVTIKDSNKLSDQQIPAPPPADPDKEDETEKTDAEKPITDEEREYNEIPEDTATVTDLSSKPPTALSTKASTKAPSSKPSSSPPKPQPSDRAKLGARAVKILKKGRPLDDGILVEIMVEAIKRLPEGTGWVMDGFPRNQTQAKNLEKALTGADTSNTSLGRESSRQDLTKDKKKKSKLAPDPKPQAPAPDPSSGVDLVLLFDLHNETCLKRSAGRTYSIVSSEQYHEEFKPPPEGTATGLSKDQVLPVEDSSHDMQQIQHRISSFSTTWPRIEKWYSGIGNLKTVDASQEQETVFLEVEKLFEDTVRKIQGLELEESIIKEMAERAKQEEEEARRLEEKAKEEAAQPPPEEVPEENKSATSSKKSLSRSGSAKRSGSTDSKKGKKSRDSSKEKKSRPGSSKSPKRGKSGKKGKRTPTPEPDPELIPPGTPPPLPGTDDWVYVNLPIEEELANTLSPYWEETEKTYIDHSKKVFRKVRVAREKIIRYFYSIRKDYVSYLKRPDHKQEFVAQWQNEFNAVSDDLRDDEETRGELHERVDDLRERLWSICDERKEQAEVERGSVMKDGWLEDMLGVLTNDYITLMQGEVDRYQDTVRMLKDYYRGMEGLIPDELNPDYARIPLVALPIAKEEIKPEVIETEATEGDEQADADEVKSEGGKSGAENSKSGAENSKSGAENSKSGAEGSKILGEASKSGVDVKSKKSEESKIQEEDKKSKIPLVPRRPDSPDAAAKAKADKTKGKSKEGDDLPPPPTDPDQKLLYDGYVSGLAAIEKLMAAEQAAREAEEAAEREREAQREAEKTKAQAKSKKGDKKGKKSAKSAKSNSPSAKKKGDKTPPTTPLPPEESETEEDREKKRQLIRARDEFFAAISEEATAAKLRLTLIRLISNNVLGGLKESSEKAYTDMNDWLGARFLKEMESIDQMSEVMRHAIEEGIKIKEELVLTQEEFIVNEDVKTVRTPSPAPRPPAAEPVGTDCFTVQQILDIYKQFKLIAPTGILSLAAFQNTMQDLTVLTHGSEQIPDHWFNMSQDKLEYLTNQLSSDGECIDWRAFLLAAAHPWPEATQVELLDTLQRFKEMDQKDTGFVTREQYDRTVLWFSGMSSPGTPCDPSEPYPYDRQGNLKSIFFDIFADHSTEPPQLDYIKMLVYFAGSSNAYVGFLRALSIISGNHIPRIPVKVTDRSPTAMSQASLTESFIGRENTEVDELPQEEDIPESAIQARVPLNALVQVLHQGEIMRGDSHRFSVQADPEDLLSKDRLEGIYHELGSSEQDPVLFTLLIEHPIVQDIIMSCNTYKTLDIKALLCTPVPEQLEVQSMKTSD